MVTLLGAIGTEKIPSNVQQINTNPLQSWYRLDKHGYFAGGDLREEHVRREHPGLARWLFQVLLTGRIPYKRRRFLDPCPSVPVRGLLLVYTLSEESTGA